MGVASLFLLTGCATIASGTTQKVSVSSNPSGAMAKADGTHAALTPTVFTLERKSDHTIEISKDGYRTSTVILRKAFNGMTTGNILIGGIIGGGVDAMSGAMYKLVPERVDVTLEKAEPEDAAAPIQQDIQKNINEFAGLSTSGPPATVLSQSEKNKKLYALDQLLREKRISEVEYNQRKQPFL